MNLRDTLRINEAGHLEIGGADTVDLVKRFGTPLYALDYAYIANVASAFVSALRDNYGEGAVAFASKAFCSAAVYKLISGLGLYADTVSKGEMYTAFSGKMLPERIILHGNNKQAYEIDYAVENGAGYIVLDAGHEAAAVDAAAKKHGKIQRVLVRVNPGVEAHTHRFVQTARADSKFGFSIADGCADAFIKSVFNYPNLEFCGVHCHIGSQIFDEEAYGLAIDVMTDYIKRLGGLYGIAVKVLNLGGGFGVHYTEKDPYYTAENYAEYVVFIAEKLKESARKKDIAKPFLIIEPGRSLIAEAGITLYTVGAVKDIKGIKKYYAVDGGMFENPRYVMYRSEYSAIVANRATEPFAETVSLTGKCCESGDMIAVDIPLQRADRGDIIAVFSTGAYNYSMSSRYNGNLRPPVVMVKNGQAEYIVKPETYDDLIRHDIIPNFLK
ncbi:MAG: diaminopimelate decarboxylase [Clostridiales bacterium]|jgi:diaminopimelate decarboxylase|nr:diaminopimelate decarboxylase [Clostridiales bacterium]